MSEIAPLPTHERPELYINRELSWLDFNARVLEEAQDERNPLLERVKFMAIVASNLDEFYEIRVAGLLQLHESGANPSRPDGLTPAEQLERIAQQAHDQVAEQYRCWNEDLIPALAAEGIYFWEAHRLKDEHLDFVRQYWREELEPILTPIVVDPAHPFPHVLNKALCIGALLEEQGQTMMGVATVPRVLPRILRLPDQGDDLHFVTLGRDHGPTSQRAIFRLQSHRLGPIPHHPQQRAIRQRRRRRQFAGRNRGAGHQAAPSRRRAARNRSRRTRPASIAFATAVRSRRQPSLSGQRAGQPPSGYDSLRPRPAPRPQGLPLHPRRARFPQDPDAFFDSIRASDILLHHPYESFSTVIDFIRMAANDPKVLAIKQTIYRTGDDSEVGQALIDAAERRKEVTVLVELKARGDEAANIEWAKRLEDSGIHVIYGIMGLKTHCKLSMLVRRDQDRLRRYAHLGTGNYNHTTARLYTDLGLITAEPTITAEVAEVFNMLTAHSRISQFEKLLVAPPG